MFMKNVQFAMSAADVTNAVLVMVSVQQTIAWIGKFYVVNTDKRSDYEERNIPVRLYSISTLGTALIQSN